MFKWIAILGGLALAAYVYASSRIKEYTHGILSFDFRANGTSILTSSINLANLGETQKSAGTNDLLTVKAQLILDAIYLDCALHMTLFGVSIDGSYRVKAGTISNLVKVTEGIEYTIIDSPIKLTVFVKLIPA
jgi:hypothetical protein